MSSMSIDRREFVVGVATLLAGVVIVPVVVRPEVLAQGEDKVFKETAEGPISESTHGGTGWQFNLKMPPECSVQKVYQEGPYTYVQIGLREFQFVLKSEDGKKWRTLNS
jgi:hypothetical protein